MKLLQNFENMEINQALEEYVVSMYTLLSSIDSAKMEVFSSEETIWSLTHVPFPLFNIVFRSKFKEVNAEETIQEIIAKCRSNNVPMLFQVGPNSEPDNLSSILEKNGFELSDEIPGMACEIQKLKLSIEIPSGFKIKRVADESMVKIYMEVIKGVFGMPDVAVDGLTDFFTTIGFEENSPVQHFIGFLDEIPVATSLVVMGPQVAGILNVTTKPEARRKGIGTFITSFPLQFAKNRGYKIGVLTSSEEAFEMYKKMGFQEMCKIKRYMWSPQPTS